MHVAYIGRFSIERLKAVGINLETPLMPKWSFGVGTDVIMGLWRRGHEVSLITYDVQVRSVQCFSIERMRVWIVPGRKTKWQFLSLFNKEVNNIRHIIRKIKPDVVFAQWTYENAYAGLTSGYPTLCVGHDSPWTVLKMFRNIYALFHAFYCQLFVVPRMKHLSVVSQHIEEDFREQCRYKGESVLIPNGIKIEGNTEAESRSKLIRRNPKTIVCVSQAGRLKNTQALIKAFELLKTKHPDWRLKMYGQGLPDGLATRKELDRVLREEADVFCSPSLEESFGMVFVEAMLQGVPCVGGGKSGAVPWVICDGGVTCDVTNHKALADCLEKVMLDYEGRKKMSAAGVKRVVENFNIDRVVDLYERELKRVAEEGR